MLKNALNFTNLNISLKCLNNANECSEPLWHTLDLQQASNWLSSGRLCSPWLFMVEFSATNLPSLDDSILSPMEQYRLENFPWNEQCTNSHDSTKIFFSAKFWQQPQGFNSLSTLQPLNAEHIEKIKRSPVEHKHFHVMHCPVANPFHRATMKCISL